MKRYFKYCFYALAAAAVSGLAACSSEEGAVLGGVTPTIGTAGDVWLSFSIADPNATRAGDADLVRAGEPMPLADTDDGSNAAADSRIYSVVAYLLDNNGAVKSVGKVESGDLSYNGSSWNVKVRMNSMKLATNTEYSLAVVANTDESVYKSLLASWNADKAPDSDFQYSYKVAQTAIPTSGIPMTTLAADRVSDLRFDDGDKFDYPKENPYNTNLKATNKQVINLTRIWAGIGFADASKNSDNTFDIDNETLGNLQVQFVRAAMVNLPSTQYLMPHANNGFTLSPSSSSTLTYFNNLATADVYREGILSNVSNVSILSDVNNDSFWQSLDGAAKYNEGMDYSSYTPLFYVPEHFRAANDVKCGNSTGLLLEARLLATDNTPAELKGYLEGTTLDASGKHSDLYYFDDGLMQTMPVVKKSITISDEKSILNNWYKIQWSDDDKAYLVRYLRIIRHGGLIPATSTSSETDLRIDEMEYGVLRNWFYPVAIKSVGMLPHPYNPADIPERNDREIYLQINPAKWIQWHRGAFEVEELTNS